MRTKKVNYEIEIVSYVKLFVIAFIILILAIVSSIFFSSQEVKAGDGKDERFKYYHMITVESGDSLWSLAEDNSFEDNRNQFIKEVQSINHLKTDMVKEGQRIMVPYYSTEYKVL